MLTNWSTISASIRTLQEYEAAVADENSKLTKKEKLDLDRKRLKLDRVLGGIRNMGGKPDAIFIIDTNRESLAIAEAKRLGIPVIAVVDTNCDPDGLDYVVPGNDDASKAIELYLKLSSEAILAGIQEGLANAGVDIGSVEFSVNKDDSVVLTEVLADKPKEEQEKKKKTPVITKKKAPAKKKPATADVVVEIKEAE